MRPLTLDDLMPLDEYAARRRELFESQRRYLDRYRRVRVGPRTTLVFENRQTLWFRVQEILRVTRLIEPAQVQAQLDLHNPLLPGHGQLRAALLIDEPEDGRVSEDMAAWATLAGEAVCLRVADRVFAAMLWTCRPEDRAAGAAHWLQFAVDPAGRKLLGQFRQPADCAIAHGPYQHASQPLSEDVRQSLVEDLELSDRDG